jgi:hypothetical protein
MFLLLGEMKNLGNQSLEDEAELPSSLSANKKQFMSFSFEALHFFLYLLLVKGALGCLKNHQGYFSHLSSFQPYHF